MLTDDRYDFLLKEVVRQKEEITLLKTRAATLENSLDVQRARINLLMEKVNQLAGFG